MENTNETEKVGSSPSRGTNFSAEHEASGLADSIDAEHSGTATQDLLPSVQSVLARYQRWPLWMTTAKNQNSKPYPEVPSVYHAVIRGGVGFGLVSLAAFSVWAFCGKWFQSHLGETGLYGACAFVFVAFSGLLLHPLAKGPGALFRFYRVFIPAFLAYAIVWCIAWFALRFGVGEWLGSLLGSASFVGVMSWRMRSTRGLIHTTLVLFAMNSAGYFLGGKMMHWILGPAGSALFTGLSSSGLLVVGKLAWGLLYGFGFGAGIGYAFHAVQKNKAQPEDCGG